MLLAVDRCLANGDDQCKPCLVTLQPLSVHLADFMTAVKLAFAHHRRHNVREKLIEVVRSIKLVSAIIF
jgi:hypothetical protein